MLKFFSAAAVAFLLVEPALAQGISPQWAQPPQWARPQTAPPIQTYQPQPQMPQTWTGVKIGSATTVWSGSNGGMVTCFNIGIVITCD